METENMLVVQFRFGKRTVLCVAALFFLCWNPHFLGSETLTLTTYYPAPYGGYARLLTTGDTVLARDSGTVKWGNPLTYPDGVTLKPEQGGAIELGGAGLNPYIDFKRVGGADFNARIQNRSGGVPAMNQLQIQSDGDINLASGRHVNISAGGLSGNVNITAPGSVRFGTSALNQTILRTCRWRFYSYVGAMAAGGSTTLCPAMGGIVMLPVTRVGTSLPLDWVDTVLPGVTSTHNRVGYGEDTSGWMLCCPIQPW